MQERGLSAYLAELIGTFLLVFFITSVVVLFVARPGDQAQFGSDFAVVGLVHAFLLFGLIVMFGVVSGGHFNPAVTLAAAAIKRISPIDAVDLHARPALGRRARRAAHQGPAARRGSRHPLRRGRSQQPARRQLPGLDRRGDRHLLPRARDPRRGLLARRASRSGRRWRSAPRSASSSWSAAR